MQAQQSLSQLLMSRQNEGTFRWTYCCFPTHALAQEAGMSLSEYENFVYGACFLDEEDPVEAWKQFAKQQQRYVDFLNGKQTIRIVGKDTDLTVSVEGRTWINSDAKLNMPDGEVYTSPVEDTANGTIYFDYPAIFQGVAVEGVRFTFEKGQIVKFEAERGYDFLKQILSLDDNVKRLGEIAIGTNQKIQTHTRNILFDEKIGGSCHLAIGYSLPGTGGKNASAVHWDMIKNMKQGGEIYADGDCFYRDGAFLI